MIGCRSFSQEDNSVAPAAGLVLFVVICFAAVVFIAHQQRKTYHYKKHVDYLFTS
jgi:hypothetical protein